MPYCTQCSHALADEHRFCPGCGTAVLALAGLPGVALKEDVTRTTAKLGVVTLPVSSGSSSSLHGRFEPGTRIGNRYRVVALLGRGGMGEVYRADDLELAQPVALKFLPHALANKATDLARFRNEVRLARQIAHQNVCRVYDIGEADGHVFLSMEYIDGEDLASVLRRMGRPSPDKAIEIARQICLGLAAAHDGGMLHRDMKPANIMIDGRGRVRITDFGLAGLAEDLAEGVEVAGTPAYMAPEQLTRGRVSVKSDVYALGLVLYEVFTGTRVFATNNFAELRTLHESKSRKTPSQLVRDLDPAVERIILQCLEEDPDLRPPSAYAVLGALPGSDPLAAALAAGETPSPELVANAGDKGTTSPLTAIAGVVVGLAAIAIWAAIVGPDFAALRQPTEVLTVRAGDILGRTGAFATLPGHTAEGFAINDKYLEHLRGDRTERVHGAKPFFFWRRWSPHLLEAPSIHLETVSPNIPSLASGQATVLLDTEGRLIGLKALPADTTRPGQAPPPDWNALFRAAGLDPSAFTVAAVAGPVPAVCDTVAAWSGKLPWAGSEPVTIQAGASHGRLVYFTIVHDWGTTTDPLDGGGASRSTTALEWLNFLVLSALPFAGSLYFGARNLALGRGDRKGATRIALFVLAMNILQSAFTTRLSEDGVLSLGWDWVSGRGIAHSLMHAVTMWFAYIALEPYVRRLWPRLLVSWARLVSGRVRDPLVGRDLLVGAVAGAVLSALEVVVQFGALKWGHGGVPTLVTDDSLAAVTSLSLTAFTIVYAASLGVLQTMRALVLVLVPRLVIGRTWPAVVACTVLMAVSTAYGGAPTVGWLVAGTTAAVWTIGLFVTLMRFGLLPGVTTVFVTLVMYYGVGTLDFSSWYADRALVSMGLILAVLIYGAATALAGNPIFGDPLRDVQAAGK